MQDNIVISGMAYIPKHMADIDVIEQELSFKNPEYLAKVRWGSIFNKTMPEEYLYFWDETRQHYVVPRNFPSSFLLDSTQEAKKVFKTADRPLKNAAKFEGTLRDYQVTYLETFPGVSRRGSDVLMQAPCGHGKTIMSVYYITQVLKQKAIIITPTNGLAEQWYNSFSGFTPNLVITQVIAQEKITYSMFRESDIVIITNDLLKSIINILYSMSDVRARFRDISQYFERYKEEFPDAKHSWLEMFQNEFGCVALDEYHRFGALSWSKAIGIFSAKYRITCTATPRRGDDMFRLLDYSTGKRYVLENQFEPADVYYLRTSCEVFPVFNHLAEKRLRGAKDSMAEFNQVKMVFYDWVKQNKLSNKVSEDGYLRINSVEGLAILKRDKQLSEKYVAAFKRALQYAIDKFTVGAIETQVVQDCKRVKQLLSVVKHAIDEGRTVLVLSKRKSVLVAWHNLFTNLGYKSCVMIGGAKGTSKNKSTLSYAQTTAQVIFGIDRLVKEGFDVDRVDTLVLIHPLSDMEQAVGRTIRVLKGKKTPVVVGVSDPISMFQGIVHKGNKFLGHANLKGTIDIHRIKAVLSRP